MTDNLSIAIAGAAGRMGRQLVAAALDAGHTVTGGTEAATSDALGSDLGALASRDSLGVTPVTDPVLAAERAGVWLDFTAPAATLAAVEALRHTAVRGIIIGTTGFSDTDLQQINGAAERFAIVKAGNFSLGVTLMSALTKLAAERLGPEWDIEISETHHRRKVDAPSGTALMLGETAADGRGKPLEQIRARPYDGQTGPRIPGKIGFSVRRAGDVIGEHEVMFGTEKEYLTIGHVATDRAVFAEGAIKAAEWAMKADPGLYDMSDVLGL